MQAPESLGVPSPAEDPSERPAPADRPEPRGPSLEERWERVLDGLRRRLRREQLETWFTRATLVDVTGGAACIAVHNGFTRDWVANYYAGDLAAAVEEALGAPHEVVLKVDPERTPAARPVTRSTSGCPRACSGDMYAGVPRTASDQVTASGPSMARASPKSVILIRPSSLRRTLAGFRSR